MATERSFILFVVHHLVLSAPVWPEPVLLFGIFFFLLVACYFDNFLLLLTAGYFDYLFLSALVTACWYSSHFPLLLILLL